MSDISLKKQEKKSGERGRSPPPQEVDSVGKELRIFDRSHLVSVVEPEAVPCEKPADRPDNRTVPFQGPSESASINGELKEAQTPPIQACQGISSSKLVTGHTFRPVDIGEENVYVPSFCREWEVVVGKVGLLYIPSFGHYKKPVAPHI